MRLRLTHEHLFQEKGYEFDGNEDRNHWQDIKTGKLFLKKYCEIVEQSTSVRVRVMPNYVGLKEDFEFDAIEHENIWINPLNQKRYAKSAFEKVDQLDNTPKTPIVEPTPHFEHGKTYGRASILERPTDQQGAFCVCINKINQGMTAKELRETAITMNAMADQLDNTPKTPIDEAREFEWQLKAAIERLETMTPKEQVAHWAEQRRSWARGEAGIGSDADEARARWEMQEKEAIPSRIFYDEEMDRFRDQLGRPLDGPFRNEWYDRREDFPQWTK